MQDKIKQPEHIVKHLINGALNIQNEQEVEDVLAMLPRDAALYKAFADLLVRLKAPDAAAKVYGKASEVHIEKGLSLQAIGAKLLEWNYAKPSQQDAWAFFSSLRKSNLQNTPLQKFFTRLAFPELVTILSNLELVRLPPNKMVKKFGAAEDYLYFIVSGNLTDTPCRPLKYDNEISVESSHSLGPDQFVGDVYPFHEERISQSFVKTMTRVELVKISKPRLSKVCSRYPQVEQGIANLYRHRSDSGTTHTSHTVRKSTRHEIKLRIRMQFNAETPDTPPAFITGYSNNISMGGLSVILDSTRSLPAHGALVGKGTCIIIELPHQTLSLSIRGTVVWSQLVTSRGRVAEALGIRFNEMPPKLSGLLVVFASTLSDIT